MLQLLLLRHAKSSWADTDVDDRDRPLTKRGKAAAQAMGAVMRERGLTPELVLCSPARRAKSTWEIVSEELKAKPKVLVEESLYDFGNGGRLLDTIRDKGGKSKLLLLVGHNPSLERLAIRLSAQGDEKLKDRIEKKYPTGALSGFAADIAEWSALDETCARLTHFIRPKDVLAEAD